MCIHWLVAPSFCIYNILVSVFPIDCLFSLLCSCVPADKKRLEEMIPGAGLEQRREISRLRQYTLQLERQLRPHLQSTSMHCLAAFASFVQIIINVS